MKKLVTLVVLIGLGAASAAWAETREAVKDRLDLAGTVLHAIMSTPDNGIPEEVLTHAKCLAVVPNMSKSGVVFGAEDGRGAITCRTAKGWSAPAFFAIAGGTWGKQIGIEGADVVMVIQNNKGMEQFSSSKFKLGVDVSEQGGPLGRHANPATAYKSDTEILTYARTKGVLAGYTLTGASILRDYPATEALYGRDQVSNESVLSGKVAVPAEALLFLNAINEAKAQAIAPK